jgi:capsular exopolysaccharide synthesis family protein
MAESAATARPDLQAAWGLLRRRWAVMLPFLLIPVAAFVFSSRQTERYTASASILFSDKDTIASAEPDREAATNVELLSLGEIQRGIDRRVGEGGRAEDVDISEDGTANVLKITATDPSAERAARTANAYGAAYIAFRRDAARAKIGDEQRFVRNELERLGDSRRDKLRARDLKEQLRRLEFDRTQEHGGARMVQLATPPASPSSPRPVRNTVIGGIVALFLALLTALLYERLDPRMVTPNEVAATLGRPILGLIRKSRALARAPLRNPPAPADADDFLALRAHLRYSGGGGVQSVLITSSSEGDGKTTIAWNLARAAAGRETRVLFVEGDLRHPTLAQSLGLDADRNLVGVLDGNAALRDVMQEVAVPSGENGRVAPRIITVALAGEAPTRSTDAVAWERLGAALREAERDFDLIVIDTAPMLLVPDAIPLLSNVGGVLVIGRLRRTPRAALAQLREQLDNVGAPTLGAVVNSVGKDARYGYGYGAQRG